MNNEIVQFLARVDPFSFLPKEEIERLADTVTLARHPKDTILFIQGESHMDHLYVVMDGVVERYTEEFGRKTFRGFAEEGDIYGGVSLLLNAGVSLRTVRVEEEATFCLVPKADFLDLCARYEEFREYFSNIFGKRMLEKSYGAMAGRSTRTQEETGLPLLNQRVESIYSDDIAVCRPEEPIQEVAARMVRKSCSAVLVEGPDGRFVGILTDRDLREKVVAGGLSPALPVSSIMSSPVASVSEDALVSEAILAMVQKNIKHLAVTDASGRVLGMTSDEHLLLSQTHSTIYLIRDIHKATQLDDVMDKHAQLPLLFKTLINSGVKAERLTRLISACSDAILRKLVEFALNELGPPPVRFTFMVLGSEGRNEQTFKTDQDNAVVFEDVPPESLDSVTDYFLKFGDKVCTWLDRAGYDFCKGGVMAKNPMWCRPISAWKKYFTDWIHTAEPEALLQASIFFDFRSGFGDDSLIHELRAHLFGSLGQWAGFFRHLTENTLVFKPPLGFFRSFVVESKGKHRNKLDIKSAMTPIVDYARIYALKNRISATNTLERLKKLVTAEQLSHEDYEDISQAYVFLMQLRLVHQVRQVTELREEPDNHINPKDLTRIEQNTLKEIFKRVERYQGQLRIEFTGEGFVIT